MALDMHPAKIAELPALETIFLEAFPPEEQMPFEFLMRRVRNGRAEFWAFTDEADGARTNKAVASTGTDGSSTDAGKCEDAGPDEAAVPVGLAYCFAPKTADDPVYLYYFAMADGARGKGYGTEAMALLAEHYAGHTIFLALQPRDAEAENAEQRVRRHAFYERCGFSDMPFGVVEVGIPYDVMALGGTVTFRDYRAVFARYLGWPARLSYPIKLRTQA